MKRIIALLFVLLLVFSAVGCSGYSSSYFALMLITSNTAFDASMSFHQFNGTKVFTLHCGDESTLIYSAELEEGAATVYYDNSGEKVELFKIGAGESVDSSLKLDSGTVYIIIETDGTCKSGEFEFYISD